MVALPSFKEGLPNVLLEALAMETPCVSSRIMGCPEVVIDGETGELESRVRGLHHPTPHSTPHSDTALDTPTPGYCFEAGDSSGLADALVRIAEQTPEERTTMAANGKELGSRAASRFCAHFSTHFCTCACARARVRVFIYAVVHIRCS